MPSRAACLCSSSPRPSWRPLAYEDVAARDVLIVPKAAPTRGRGMGDSIAAGVSARADSPGWLLLPADMPRVKPSTLQAVSQALPLHPVAFAQHQGRRGHPVAFSAEMYSELASLTGDEGARRLVARFPSHAVEVDDPGVLIDIDTSQDLQGQRTGAEGGFKPSAFAPDIYRVRPWRRVRATRRSISRSRTPRSVRFFAVASR